MSNYLTWVNKVLRIANLTPTEEALTKFAFMAGVRVAREEAPEQLLLPYGIGDRDYSLGCDNR